jgi:hypothetical protein
LPDDTCVRKVDLKANRKERNEKWMVHERGIETTSLSLTLMFNIRSYQENRTREREREHNYRLFLSSSTNIN